MSRGLPLATAVALLCAGSASGQLSLVQREGFVEATTSFDMQTQTIGAQDFTSFVATVDLVTEFPAKGGGIGINRALAGIDCDIDPNRIELAGVLGGSGGLADIPGFPPELVDGNGKLELVVVFEVLDEMAFLLTALPRPSLDPEDRFKLSLARTDGGGETIFEIEQDDPPMDVLLAGVFEPGLYELEYEVEYTVEGPEQFGDVGFALSVPAPGTAVLGVLALPLALRRRR